MLRSAHLLALAAAAICGCTLVVAPVTAPAPLEATVGPDPAPFSSASPGGDLPAGWKPWRLSRLKRPTEFALVNEEVGVALRATAHASASGVQFQTSVDLREYPHLHWRWKVPQPIEGADNTIAYVEDSPARIVVEFEGGRESLPEFEQINYDLALAVSGNRLPYATLMYVWENRLPEGTLIEHHLTTRIKMIIAGSGSKELGIWTDEVRNVLEDYRRAFNEEPPRVKSIGIMSDTDNTGASAQAFFGDIHFRRK